MIVALGTAGALELIAYCDLVLPTVEILQDETGVPCNPSQVESGEVF